MKKALSFILTVILLLQLLSLTGCMTMDITSNPNGDLNLEETEEDGGIFGTEDEENEENEKSEEDDSFLHRFDTLPEEYKDHVLVKGKASGDCKALLGEVFITLLFVDDSTSSWTSELITETTAEIDSELKKLKDEAAAFGAEVNFTAQKIQVKVDFEINNLDNSSEWDEKLISAAGLPSIENVNKKLASENGADSAPIVFLLNKEKRSYAHRSLNSNSDTEYALVYESDALRHELLHVYGAEDFYYPKAVMDAAMKYYPESIMLDSTKEVDGFTAYLVGWIQTPSQTELSFLADTVSVTDDDVLKALEEEKFTGNTTKVMTTGTYTGDLVEGVIHGYGTMTFTSGDVYEGNWKNGKKHGEGTLTWADGSSYTGDWAEDIREGKGKLIWANGDVYEGDWSNDSRTGYGKLTWASGNTYEGDFKDNEIYGYGVYSWTDGSKYEGDYVDGNRHGNGTYYWPSSDYYTGSWQNGVREGQGTFVWANGATYTGEWKNDEMHGQGKYTDQYGNVTEGTFENGQFVG